MDSIIEDMREDEIRDTIYNFCIKYKYILVISIVILITITVGSAYYLDIKKKHREQDAFMFFKNSHLIAFDSQNGFLDKKIEDSLWKRAQKNDDLYALLNLSKLIDFKLAEIINAKDWNKTLATKELFSYIKRLKNIKVKGHDYKALRTLQLSNIDITLGLAKGSSARKPFVSIKELEDLTKVDSAFINLLKENLALRIIYLNNFDMAKTRKNKNIYKLLKDVISKNTANQELKDRCRAHLHAIGI